MKGRNTEIKINGELCKTCKHCVLVCPCKIFIVNDEGNVFPDTGRKALCLRCGQCMAVCNEKAVQVEGFDYERDFIKDVKNEVTGDRFYQFLATRRSVRNFKDTPVPRELLEKIVDAVHLAPFGVSPDNLEITIINNRELIEKALPQMSSFYRMVESVVNSPFKRRMLRRKVTTEKFNSIRNHLMPMISVGHYDLDGGKDNITRKAPALILFHGRNDAEEHTSDGYICLSFAALAAHSLGLGATIVSLVPPSVNKYPELRQLFGIPEGHETVCALIVGYPKINYRRGIRHTRNNVRWL